MNKSRWFGVPSISYKLLSPDDPAGGGANPPAGAEKDPAKPDDKPAEKKPVTFSSQEDVDALVEGRLARERTTLKKTLEGEIKAELEAAKQTEEDAKKGDFEKLWKAEVTKRIAVEQERDAARLEVTKSTVAARHKLSPALASRLQGTTEVELEEDAKELAKQFPAQTSEQPPKRIKPQDGNSDAGKGSSGSDSGSESGKDASGNKAEKPTRRYAFEGPNDVPIPR